MAITVDGFGAINKGNAKEIYTAWKRGDVELNKAQQAKCESFLSPEEMDEVQYDEQVTKKRGQNAIDTENTKDNGNGTEGGGTAAAAVGAAGTVGCVIASITLGAGKAVINGFVALMFAIAAIAGSAAALTMSFLFDNQLDDRKSHSDNAASDNQTMDNYTDNLAATMDMMNEDVEHYKDTQDQLTTTVNTQASQGADLQMQYDAAVAMGDVNGAQKLKEQMKTLSEADNSYLEDDLAETGGAIDEYRAMNEESLGCAESGQTVSDFLKAGNQKATLGRTNGYLCMTAGILAAATALIAAVPKIWAAFVPVDLPAGISASVMWGAVSIMMGTASKNFLGKASTESECGHNGDDMQGHVNSLREMVDQQTQYTDDTAGQYKESDKAAAESKEGAQEAAGKAVDGNKEGLANKPKEDDKKKEEPVAA